MLDERRERLTGRGRATPGTTRATEGLLQRVSLSLTQPNRIISRRAGAAPDIALGEPNQTSGSIRSQPRAPTDALAFVAIGYSLTASSSTASRARATRADPKRSAASQARMSRPVNQRTKLAGRQLLTSSHGTETFSP